MKSITIRAVLLGIVAAATPLLAQPDIRTVGGCLVVTVREGASQPQDLAPFCNGIQVGRMPNGMTFSQMYSWAPVFLAGAFDEAERGLSGSIAGITGNRTARIIIVPDPFANAGVPRGATRSTSTSIDIFITTGLISFIEGIVAASSADYAVGTQHQVQAPGFKSWLAQMRALKPRPSSGSGGPPSAPWPGPGNVSNQWVLNFIRTPAQGVYQFIFAHELGHLVLGLPSGGADQAEILRREMRVDSLAIRSMLPTSPHRNAMATRGETFPNYISNVLIAMMYYETVYGDEIRGALVPGSPVPFRTLFPARDWKRRAYAVLDAWETACRGRTSLATCRDGWREMLRESRDILDLPLPGSAGITSNPAAVASTFFSFAGLRFGDTVAAADRLYGQRSSTRPSTRLVHVRYLDDAISIAYETATSKIRFVRVNDADPVRAHLESRGIRNANLELFGMTIQAVRQRLGAEAESESGDYDYPFLTSAGQRGEVTFTCDDSRQNVCNQIRVHWINPN